MFRLLAVFMVLAAEEVQARTTVEPFTYRAVCPRPECDAWTKERPRYMDGFTERLERVAGTLIELELPDWLVHTAASPASRLGGLSVSAASSFTKYRLP